MPTEPGPVPWVFPDPSQADDDVVAVGADLAPGTILAAYRQGIFPMPVEEITQMAWWSPVRRGILRLERLHVSRSMRRSARRFSVTVDTAFSDVVDGCADPSRPGGWITPSVKSAYAELHRLGWAHSFEVWQGELLAGGLYGLAIGGLFAGESMFHRATDASKVAVMAVVDLLRDGHEGRLVDVQWATPHLMSLGVEEVPRTAYLALLRDALALPLPERWR